MLFSDLAAVSDAVRATSARKEKVALLAGALRGLGVEEVAPGTAFLSGELLQRQIGVGWASLREVPSAAAEPSLTVGEVANALAAIGAKGGPGSVAARREALAALFARATEPEQRLLRGLLVGDLRQGALEGVMTEAVARASGLPVADVRRALMLRGDLPVTAALALGPDGAAKLAAV